MEKREGSSSRAQERETHGGSVRDWCRNRYGVARKSLLGCGTVVKLLQEFSAGDTVLQIVYPATQRRLKRVHLLIERIAEVFSSSDTRTG
jgi:hypothetical protein